MPKDIQILYDLGYSIRECSPYHAQVITENSLINIWHTSKKYQIIPKDKIGKWGLKIPTQVYTTITDIIK